LSAESIDGEKDAQMVGLSSRLDEWDPIGICEAQAQASGLVRCFKARGYRESSSMAMSDATASPITP
jgi:hypothetical protein